MKILFITDNINCSAAGIVAGQLINGFSQSGIDVLVITRKLCSSLLFKKINIIVIDIPYSCPNWKDKISLIIHNTEVKYTNYLNNTYKNIFGDIKSYSPDIVLSLVAGEGFYIAELGKIISHNFNIPFHIHAVDAIPAPIHWGENKFYRNSKCNYIKSLFSSSDIFSSTNKKMLEYQLKYLNKNDNRLSLVIDNPIAEKLILGEKNCKTKKILYIGSLQKTKYGRNGFSYFHAIDSLKDKDFEFIFVGTDLDVIQAFWRNNEIPRNIKHIPWCDDVTIYIKEASLLVDIDINAKNDVFMSSKLMRYLNTDIPIINISGINSPANDLLSSEDYGAVSVNHSKVNVINAIEAMINTKIDFIKRKGIIDKYQINNVIDIILRTYNNIVL